MATTKIYAGNANDRPTLIYEVIDPLRGDRHWVPLAQIPPGLIEATVASEDPAFWTDQGFDIASIGRAFYELALLDGEVQKGISITRQLVKNNLVAPERRTVGSRADLDDYRRQAEELLLTQRVARAYTKEQTLEWYLNTNDYGNLAYGIEAAARVYFDKTAAELTLPEAAMLAAIPQSPTLNDHPEEAKRRQERVLAAMVREGYITEETAAAARLTPLAVTQGPEERFDIIAPHFALMVRRELIERFGPEQVLRGGLEVVTTLDLSLQQQAECIARGHIGRLSGQVGVDELRVGQ